MGKVDIKRAEDWDFEMPEYLADTINEFADALENDDPRLDLEISFYLENIEEASRMVDFEKTHRLYKYYLMGDKSYG